MGQLKPIDVFVRVAIAGLVALAIGKYFGHVILIVLEPLFKSIILFVQSDFSPTLEIVNHNGSSVMTLSPLTIRPYQLTPNMLLRKGAVLDSVVTSINHAILPMIIFLMGLIAWPFRNGIREISMRFIFGVLGGIIVMAVTTPLFLAARVQMNTMIYALQVGGNPTQSYLIDWMIFTESGGRWLIPIVVAIICVRLSSSVFSIPHENESN